jgi:hypothetical protein
LYTLGIQNSELKKVISEVEYNSNMYVNNSKNEITLFMGDHSLCIYDFDFKLSREVLIKNPFSIGSVQIQVNQSNNHVYGMPRYSKYFLHFNENLELTQELDSGVYGCFDYFKVFKEMLYFVKLSYIIDTVSYNSDNFIYIYNQDGSNQLEFNKKITIESSFILHPCIDVNENYIFLLGKFVNKFFISNGGDYLFLLNHDGIFLRKTRLGYSFGGLNLQLLVIDEKTICYKSNEKFIKIIFNDENNKSIEETCVDYLQTTERSIKITSNNIIAKNVPQIKQITEDQYIIYFQKTERLIKITSNNQINSTVNVRQNESIKKTFKP